MFIFTICLVCPRCGGENTHWGAQRFLEAPLPGHLRADVLCRTCAIAERGERDARDHFETWR